MKILKVDLASLRRERRRSTKFTLVFFTLLAMAWPVFMVEVVNPATPSMEELEFNSYDSEIRVEKTGRVVVKEVVEVNFTKPNTYVRSVGELAATDSNARYFSRSLGAKIDGEAVRVKDGYTGVGGHYYEIGGRLEGSHVVEFSFEIPNGIIYQDGVPTFRSRLLPRYSFSEVRNFRADLYFEAGLVKDKAVCWTTDDSKPRDFCEFTELTDNKISIEVADPAYLRPVRLVVPLRAGEYSSDRLPWSGYWDNVLGRHPSTPVLTLFTAVLLAWSLARFSSARFTDRRWQQTIAGSFLTTMLALWIVCSFTPSILLVLPAALLWAGVPAWLRSSENRMVLSEEQVQALQNASETENGVKDSNG